MYKILTDQPRSKINQNGVGRNYCINKVANSVSLRLCNWAWNLPL